MKQFFKITFASMFGFLLGSVVIFFILFMIIFAITKSAKTDDVAEIKENSILELDLSYFIPERTSNTPGFDFNSLGSKTIGLNDIIKNIKKAATNKNIAGIKIKGGFWPNDYATLEEIRNELINFKASKKFIVAYSEIFDEHSYYVASVADKIYLNPAGEIVLNGFSNQVLYLKNMFNKIGVEPILIRHGKYKSAGEPLISDKMSTENRLQIESYMGNIYNHFIKNIANSRKINESEFAAVLNDLKIRSAADAVKHRVIDSLKYADEVDAVLNKLCNKLYDEKVNIVSLKAFNKVADPNTSISDNKIAIVYLNGSINSGKGGDDEIGSDKIAETIKDIRKKTYQALVLRINSPGGSALASDVIWREIELTKKVMPVVVSMGEVAASGGYYIAAPANKIFAHQNTITGSIGVFGVMVNAQELLNNKLGIKIETVKLGKYADLGTPDRPMSADEKQIIQNEIERVYTDFTGKVAKGRKLSIAKVDSLAEGRVYSGIEAKALGLIDEFGGLEDAVKYAAKLKKLNNYRVVNFPEQKEPIEEIINMLQDNAQAWFIKNQIGQENYRLIHEVKKIQHYQGIQARLPYSLKIN